MGACCVIAAFIIAQCVATVRRWGMFWGVVKVPEGETAATLFSTLRAYLQRPGVRTALSAAVLVEIIALPVWLYVAHGAHIARLADIGWHRLHGQQVIYTRICGPTGGGGIGQRLVFPIDAGRGR